MGNFKVSALENLAENGEQLGAEVIIDVISHNSSGHYSNSTDNLIATALIPKKINF
ncbi:MAG: hypothetical protein Q8N88_06180 [Nanoarchaeota archaeon]|nr:hypothetical protein [Nanoarchaeota archaeon]